MLGQSGSTNASSIQKKLKYSARIEPYLTFLNVHQLKTGRRHTNHDRGIGRIKSVSKTAR